MKNPDEIEARIELLLERVITSNDPVEVSRFIYEIVGMIWVLDDE